MTKRMFVYELPYLVRKSLCRILDANDKWEELGGEHMGFDYTYLQCIRRKDSPTDELLTSWGNQNHSVNDLFVLLSKMQHYRAMSLLIDLVQEQYHHLMREGEELMNQPRENKNVVGQGSQNRIFQGNQPHMPQEPQGETAAANPLALGLPVTFEDNKDLGLDLKNLNLSEQKSERKEREKIVNGIKILNVPETRERQHMNGNLNEHHNVSNDQSEAAHNLNFNCQLEVSAVQKPAQERKLSNISISSSVMEFCTPAIEYEELEAAANGWDTSLILGRGGFGTVYKGIWKNTLVAIKKLEPQRDQHLQTSDMNSSLMTQSLRELKYLNSHRHDNILSLYGYSVTEFASCLVYQYMANGSLEDRLHCRQKTRPLNWVQRLNIMTGTARGIQFLHSLGKKPLVHGDIKSANILLDNNFEPRLGDFGLAREGPLQQYTHVKVSRVHGTRPYLPDEFLRGKQFSVKVDTYSFGVVLFEVATGLRAYDDSRKERFLKDHIVSYPPGELSGLADPQAGVDCCASASGLLTLGRNCVMKRPKDRPDMKIVLNDIDMLYNNYKAAERATSLAHQHILTPISPLEMQVAHDVLRNPSPKLTVQGSSVPVLIINGAPHMQQPFLFPHVLPPEGVGVSLGNQAGLPLAIHMPPPPSPSVQHPTASNTSPSQGVGVPLGNRTGLPLSIHTPSPPSLSVQPPTVSKTSPQGDVVIDPPSPMDRNFLPLVTLLGVKSESDISKQNSSVLPVQSYIQDTSTNCNEESFQSRSWIQSEVLTNTPLADGLANNNGLELSENRSTYLPRLPDLLGIKSAES